MPIASGLYYFSHEEGDISAKRTPIILIHGAGGSCLSWPPQIRRLAGERTYALDLPGHGQSEGMGRQSVEQYAEDVLAFMRELKIRTAIIVGISMGGAIALTIAMKNRGKVKALGLLGSGARLRVSPAILEMTGSPNTYESAVDLVNESCFSSEVPESMLALSKKQMMEVRQPVLLGDFSACNQFDMAGQLEKLDRPTLIICGAEDQMTPVKYSEFLRNRIPNSRLHVVEHAGHLVMLEQPDIVAGLLKNFVDELSSRGRKNKKAQAVSDAEASPLLVADSPLPNIYKL